MTFADCCPIGCTCGKHGWQPMSRNLAATGDTWESRQCDICGSDYIYPTYGGYKHCNQCLWGEDLDAN